MRSSVRVGKRISRQNPAEKQEEPSNLESVVQTFKRTKSILVSLGVNLRVQWMGLIQTCTQQPNPFAGKQRTNTHTQIDIITYIHMHE